MDTNDFKTKANRRNFIGTLAAGAAVSLTSIAPSINSFAANEPSVSSPPYEDPEEMFKRINGKHRIVFDSPHPHEIFPFAWPRVFLLTNEATGTANKDCSVVVVLRHSSIGYAMEDRVWAKYELGKTFEANDPEFYFMRLYDVDEALSLFAEDKDIDMIILIRRNETFIEKLFTASHTKHITYRSKVPILVMHE